MRQLVGILVLIALFSSWADALVGGKDKVEFIREPLRQYHEARNKLPGATIEVKDATFVDAWAVAGYDLMNMEMGTVKPGQALLVMKNGNWTVLRMSTKPLTVQELKAHGVPAKYRKALLRKK